ncbi:MAG: hypothetical protein C9356_14095 [Oleiphilus sp.]|nr:MAG: hypothetical protein C9356_14095 [Oleiphilus sp.]
MNPFLLAGIAAILIWLIIRNLAHKDPAAESCAKAVVQCLKQKPHASAQEIAEVFRTHNRTGQDIGKVTRLLKSRLVQAGIRKEDQLDVMQAVQQAKTMLEK